MIDRLLTARRAFLINLLLAVVLAVATAVTYPFVDIFAAFGWTAVGFLACCALFAARERHWRAEMLRGMLTMAEALTKESEGRAQDAIGLQPGSDDASQRLRARTL
jgi:hypothetical protein